MPRKLGRIGPLDTFRFLTVTFALVSHALLEFGAENVVGEQTWLTIRSITRTATPCLLFLFGVMGEVVYARRYREMGRAIEPRLYHRAFQCYVAFIVLAALIVPTRPESLGYLISSLGFLKLEGYNIIFALYFFLLLLLAVILPIRERFGFGGLALVVLFLWLVDWALLSRLPNVHPALSTLGDVTVGLGGIWGPSTFHSVTLVIAGMVFGNLFYRRDSGGTVVWISAAIVVISVSLIAVEFVRVGAGGFFVGIVDFSYRAANHPAYFAYGILGSLITVGVAYALYAVLHQRIIDVVNAIGGKTFSFFFLGNVVLILVPPFAVSRLPEAVAVVVSFIVLSGFLTLAWARIGARVGIGRTMSKASYDFFERLGAVRWRRGTVRER